MYPLFITGGWHKIRKKKYKGELQTMVKVRLKRIGAKKNPFYRIIVIHSTTKRSGKPIEELGYYNPKTKDMKLDKEKAMSWLSKGAQATDTVAYLIKNCDDEGKLVYKKQETEKLSKKAKAKLEAEKKAKEEAAQAAENATEETASEAQGWNLFNTNYKFPKPPVEANRRFLVLVLGYLIWKVMKEKKLKRVMVVMPVSIAGCLIMKGFALALNHLGFKVLLEDVRNLDFDRFLKFRPDFLLGYDFGFFENETFKKQLENSSFKPRQVHFFADEPKSKFANFKNEQQFEEFNQINHLCYVWDKKYLNCLKNSKQMALGVDPRLYKTDFNGYNFDITFVGRPLTEKRQKILSRIIKVFGKKLSIFSFPKHFEKSIFEIEEKKLLTKTELEIYKRSYKGFLYSESQLANVYCSSKVNLNITLQGENNLNYRVFEVCASRGFLLTDYMEDLNKNFVLGKELESYYTEEDLLEKIDFYLKNLKIAEKIGNNARARILCNHTFITRAKEILLDLQNI